MRISQDPKHLLTAAGLQVPLVRWPVRRWIVSVHVDIFTERSRADAEARRDRFRAVFDTVVDVYLTALREGYSEAQAREIVHTMGDTDFYRHGWTDVMGIYGRDLAGHYDRHADFFDRHDCTLFDPFGEFADDLPEAPETPDMEDEVGYPHATADYTDQTYVKAPLLSERTGEESG